ncbi:MAG: hypothetical protein EKK63_00295 [Acinetobacter sp.]|uniref:hypothetical protein n=1 Tax=Acinetobacter sp. TaxID=472 RepID=UPI000F93F073|nr:hypothetical protein [Acinetobacter sp.]RUP42612.1 MAG: hypothetical protein EKK63_00295 [Acinetobacter sp.]
MIKCIDFPDQQFATKEELHTALRSNAEKIIALKTAEIYKSYQKGFAFDGFMLDRLPESEVGKIGPQMKDGFVYPVLSTTKYMDSHWDVHFDGVWDQSIKQQAGKLHYVVDHELKIASVIAWPGDVKAMVKSVPWSWVGKEYEGNTEALIFEIPKSKLKNAAAKEAIEEKRPVQHSVRMAYVKIKLAINSTAAENKEYKAYYDSRINEIANKEEVEELGYFWGVEEAKIVKECSMVLAGSNDATPIRQKLTEPANPATQPKIEPANPATQTKTTTFINPNLY